MADYSVNITSYFDRLKNTLDTLDVNAINATLQAIQQAYEHNAMVFLMGNGGSGATASHIVSDMNKGVAFGKKQRFRMMSLTDNIPTVLAYANDISYDDIFIEQLKNFQVPGDVVIGISGSGNSRNVIKGIEYANDNGAVTIGFCGYDGGALKNKAHIAVHAPIHDMQISEDIHLVLGHIMMQVFMQLYR